jgi:hypothetical protein
MKKRWLALLALLCIIPATASAYQITRAHLWDTISPFTASAEATASSGAMDLSYAWGSFTLYVTATSVLGTPHVKFEYLVAPRTADTYLEPSAASDISSDLSASDAIAFNPIIAPFLKVKYTGLATNATDTIIDVWLLWNVEY